MPLLFSFLRLFVCLNRRGFLRRLGRFRLRARLSKHAQERLADGSGALDGVDTRIAHRSVLVRCGTLPAADDCSGMPHAPSRRRRLTADKADYRFRYILLDELRRYFLGVAADFADHHDRMGVRITIEEPNDIEKCCPDDRIASNADAGGLPDAKP